MKEELVNLRVKVRGKHAHAVLSRFVRSGWYGWIQGFGKNCWIVLVDKGGLY